MNAPILGMLYFFALQTRLVRDLNKACLKIDIVLLDDGCCFARVFVMHKLEIHYRYAGTAKLHMLVLATDDVWH